MNPNAAYVAYFIAVAALLFAIAAGRFLVLFERLVQTEESKLDALSDLGKAAGHAVTSMNNAAAALRSLAASVAAGTGVDANAVETAAQSLESGASALDAAVAAVTAPPVVTPPAV